jgi:DNA-3-methyladenine glycosylase
MMLPVAFYSRPTVQILEELIGKVLIRKSREGLTSGIIVEAEAYRGEDDPASFASRGRTKRSEMLYGLPARAFVYLTYGRHHLLNVVTEQKGFPAAVLIRALEPLDGLALMQQRRKTDDVLNLCSGPAKLCQALDIDLTLNGVSVSSPRSSLILVERANEDEKEKDLVWRPRVGIREGRDRLWRVYLKASPFVSVK